MRPWLVAVATLCILVPVSTRPQSVGTFSSQAQTEAFFPVGVWYGGGLAQPPVAPTSAGANREAWLRDLKTIRSLGFNHVRTWVDWASAEPVRGEFHLEALQQLLALADNVGLRVVVQLYSEPAPEWLGDAFPDGRLVPERGERVAPHGFCTDHEGVQAALSRFVQAVSRAARDHPSFLALDARSEPGTFCFCPQTVERFRSWLREKYGTLAALNEAWRRTFGRWEQVGARIPPGPGIAILDWRTFMAWKLEQDLRLRAAAARDGAAPAVQVTSHSATPIVVKGVDGVAAGPDDWLMARSVDHYGVALHPKPASSADALTPVSLTAALDAIRSAAGDRGWWVAQLQAGQRSTGSRAGAVVTPEDVRLWGWASLSRGARGISYYAWYPMSGGTQSHGTGLIELDGSLTERARAAGALADLVARNANLFTALRPERSRVGIVHEPRFDRALGKFDEPDDLARASLSGVYRALATENIQADFLHSDEVASGNTSAYAVLYFPRPLLVTRNVGDALLTYVQGGGVLIAEARPGWVDERLAASARIPGGALEEIFGAREVGLRDAEPLTMTVTRDAPGALGALAGIPVRGSRYLEILAPRPGAIVLATAGSGEPVAVQHTVGTGRAVLLGSFVSAAFDENPQAHAAAGRLIATLVRDAGVQPRVVLSGAAGEVEARLLESDRAMLLVAINYGTEPRRVRIDLPREAPAGEWLNLETGDAIPLAGRAGSGPGFEYDFPARDVLALLARKP